ncbi:uncharacterized protein LOC131150916 [Malania oleifera]|uniref:uncharacterized protein LOC131150916 n=1 Tax=Malania oleifera TaxID=397392 RepID=UPI0025AE63B3|nr:uncharacterized protein LOC131150916 [Malania oleifera]
MEASNDYNDLVILNDDQLGTLAEKIRYQEATVIHQTNFKTQKERDEFLYDSKSNQESVLALLATGQEVVTKYQDDAVKGPIARDLHLYIVYCCNSALQTVPNYHVRKDYLQKIRDHVDTLLSVLDDLDAAERSAVVVVGEGVVQYKNAMLIYTRQFKSTLSSNFSAGLKNEGIKYENLVQTYVNKLGFQGHFKDLSDEQKAQVYESIIARSGRESSPIKDVMSAASKAKGIAVNVYKVGSVVWDIYTSDHKFKTATRDAVVSIAKEGGSELGEVIGAALATDLLEVEAEALFVTLAGIAGGFIGSFIVGAFAGWLMDAILDTTTFPSSTEGLHCYVSSLPDGVALARAIAHDGTKDPNANSTN